MICIKCSNDTSVINSRPHKKTPSVWRRRQCRSCDTTFTTHETVSDSAYPLLVTSSSGKESPFSLPTLMVSIFQVFGHHDLETASEESYWLAQTIAQTVQASATDKITKKSLAKETYDTLSLYDEVAGMQYGVRHHQVNLGTIQKPRRGRPRGTTRPH